jgi:hypothetical protein
MTAAIAQFIRKASRTSLHEYFQEKPHPISEKVNWGDTNSDHVKPLLKAVDEMTDSELAMLKVNAERIHEMTDEVGQRALLSVVKDSQLETYLSLESAYDRALFVFIRFTDDFRHAEDIRYADEYRKGRMWDGFLGPVDVEVSRDATHIEEFQKKVVEHFRTGGKLKVEIFNRTRSDLEYDAMDLVQIMIYREGLPDSYLAFEGNDNLVTKVRQPVDEMVITYEPKSGAIEVIAPGKECREELVKMFSATLLQSPLDEAQRVPLKKYNLSTLLSPRSFPTDPDDGIEVVKIMMLELKPFDNGNKVRLSVTAKEQKTIHDVSREWFEQHDPLRTGFLVAKVKLSIRFKPDSTDRRGKTLPVEITWPNGCDLKGKTTKEQLIGEKYLKRWGLVEEIK